MNLLPLPADYVIYKRKNDGKLYMRSSNFKIGHHQPIIMKCAGLIFAWLGQVDMGGNYLYKNCSVCNSLTFR